MVSLSRSSAALWFFKSMTKRMLVLNMMFGWEIDVHIPMIVSVVNAACEAA